MPPATGEKCPQDSRTRGEEVPEPEDMAAIVRGLNVRHSVWARRWHSDSHPHTWSLHRLRPRVVDAGTSTQLGFHTRYRVESFELWAPGLWPLGWAGGVGSAVIPVPAPAPGPLPARPSDPDPAAGTGDGDGDGTAADAVGDGECAGVAAASVLHALAGRAWGSLASAEGPGLGAAATEGGAVTEGGCVAMTEPGTLPVAPTTP